MATTQAGGESGTRSGPDAGSGVGAQPGLPRYVDWFVAAVLVLTGLAALFGGAALFQLADVSLLAELVEEGTLQSDVFGDEALVDVSYATAWWGGVGVLVTGLATWAVAGWYVVRRRRERRRGAETSERVRSAGTNALLGAVASVVLSFVPFSQVLGGIVAGYLEGGDRDASIRVGGLSGVLAVLPVVLVLVFVLGGLVAGAVEVSGAGALALFGGLLVVTVLFSLVFSGALGALGGYVGGRMGADVAGED